MTSKATITVDPQHVPPAARVHWEVDYSGAPKPNDIHIVYKKVSAFRGDKDIVPARPFKGHFDRPAEPGAYDIRVRFTLDGKYLKDGERTGQFLIDL